MFTVSFILGVISMVCFLMAYAISVDLKNKAMKNITLGLVLLSALNICIMLMNHYQ